MAAFDILLQDDDVVSLGYPLTFLVVHAEEICHNFGNIPPAAQLVAYV